MSLIETECLVLRCYNLAEADKIVVMLTRDHGLVRGVAKGAKRLKSKFGSTLEPFSLVSVCYAQKENLELVSIKRSDLVRSCFFAANDPEAQEHLAYIAELLISFVPPNEPNERIYRMIRACLQSFAQETDSLSRIVVYFEIWILRLSGYLPEWDRCVDCGVIFTSTDISHIQPDFRLQCGNCNRSGNGRILSGSMIEIIGMSKKLSPEEFLRETANKTAILSELSVILGSLISHVIGNSRAVHSNGAIRY